jgi:pentatricopeptide repeat protein
LRELTTSKDADIGDWGQIVSAYIRMKQPEQALAVLDEMDKWIGSQIESGDLQGENITEARYYQERLRAAALMELGRLDEVMTLFNDLYAIDGADAISPHLVYTRLIQEGMYAEALRYVDRDQARPVRAGFWRGLVQRYMGEQAKATRTWESVLKEETVLGDMQSIVERILTQYYLGDPKGEGLELMLRAQREQTRISWMIFLLTGLGWIIRGDYKAAHSNFRLAIAQVKSMGESKTLAHQYWRFVQDLAPADQAAQFARYFDTRTPATGEAAPSETAESAPSGESEE